MVALVRRHRRAVGTTVRRAAGDEVPGAVEKETGPATVQRVPPGVLNALPVHAPGPLGIVAVVRDADPRQLVGDDATDALLFLMTHCQLPPLSAASPKQKPTSCCFRRFAAEPVAELPNPLNHLLENLIGPRWKRPQHAERVLTLLPGCAIAALGELLVAGPSAFSSSNPPRAELLSGAGFAQCPYRALFFFESENYLLLPAPSTAPY